MICDKKKMLLRAVGLIFAISLVMHAVANWWLIPDLEKSELEEFQSRYKTVEAAIRMDIEAASRVIDDWGNWDTLWDFANGSYPQFLDENEPQHDLRVLGLAAYAVYSRAGYKVGFVANGESEVLLESLRLYADKMGKEGGWLIEGDSGYFVTGGQIVAPNRAGSSGRLFVIKKVSHQGLEFSTKAERGLNKKGPTCEKCVDGKHGVLAFSENVQSPDGGVAGSMTYHVGRKMFFSAKKRVVISLLLGLALLSASIVISILARNKRASEFFELERKLQREVDLGLMLPGIVHEIRNPLAIAYGYCEFVVDGKKEGAVKTIKSSLKRIEAILSGTRSYCRADKSWAIRDINAVVKDISVVVPYLLKFQAKLQTSIWPEELLYLGSEDAMHQIISNLVTNARDALEGRPDGLISIKTYPKDDAAIVEVSDNGPGIPVEIRERVFQRDFTTKPVGKGSGLGLPIVRQLVEDMNGEITIGESELGGAAMLVKVPRGRKDETSDCRQ